MQPIDRDIEWHRQQIAILKDAIGKDARGRLSQAPGTATLRETLARTESSLKHLEELRAKRT